MALGMRIITNISQDGGVENLTLIRPPVVKSKKTPVTDFVKNPSCEAIQKTNSDLISN